MNVSHERDLRCALSEIDLVNSDSIDLYFPTLVAIMQMAKYIEEIGRHVEWDAVDEDFAYASHVGKCFLAWGISVYMSMLDFEVYVIVDDAWKNGYEADAAVGFELFVAVAAGGRFRSHSFSCMRKL